MLKEALEEKINNGAVVVDLESNPIKSHMFFLSYLPQIVVLGLKNARLSEKH